MSVCKRTLALMAACLLLATAFSVGTTQAVATEESAELPAQVFDFSGAQVGTDADGNYALRFGFNLGCTGVTRDEEYNTVIDQDAKVCIEGYAYPLVGFGAIVALDRDDATVQRGTYVPARKLYDINDDGTVTYTARVTGLTADNLETAIYVKAYIYYRDGNDVKTHTTEVYSGSYRKTYFAANSPKAGDAVHEYLTLGEVTADLETNTGTMVVQNISSGYETDQDTFHLLYTCYDKDGESLGDVRINTGRINAGKASDPLPFTLPEGTYSMQFKAANGYFYTDGWH